MQSLYTDSWRRRYTQFSTGWISERMFRGTHRLWRSCPKEPVVRRVWWRRFWWDFFAALAVFFIHDSLQRLGLFEGIEETDADDYAQTSTGGRGRPTGGAR
jgi:hypothetical protein